MRQVHVALLGLGTVNRGLYRVIEKQKEALYALGYELIVDTVCVRDTEKAKLFLNNDLIKVTSDVHDILSNERIEVVFEALSGANPAARYLQKLLEGDKHIITANKAALAENFEPLMEIAYHHRKRLCFEAAVCAGTPVIQALERLIKVDKVKSIKGILNGTTNFILSKMAQENLSYEEALNQAKTLGYAEADEGADVDGIDAANKLALLANMAFYETVDPQSISKDSIRDIKNVTQGTKVISTVRDRGDGELELKVSLEEVTHDHLFYNIPYSQNILEVELETLGTLVFIGPGAGGEETGTAMYLDFIKLTEERRI